MRYVGEKELWKTLAGKYYRERMDGISIDCDNDSFPCRSYTVWDTMCYNEAVSRLNSVRRLLREEIWE